MSIKIEMGVDYITRAGEKVHASDISNNPAIATMSNGRVVWADGGKTNRNPNIHSPADVVGVWPAEKAEPVSEQQKAEPDIKAALADEAKKIVTGARRSAYGTPEQNFERIARFWQAYFENTGRGDVKIIAADVSPMMRLMKEARLSETPDHYDSFVDLVGYALTGAEVNGVKKPVDTL